MSTIKGGAAAYKDCAELCATLLAKESSEFVGDPSGALSHMQLDAAKLATRFLLSSLEKAFREKAKKLEAMAARHGGSA